MPEKQCVNTSELVCTTKQEEVCEDTTRQQCQTVNQRECQTKQKRVGSRWDWSGDVISIFVAMFHRHRGGVRHCH